MNRSAPTGRCPGNVVFLNLRVSAPCPAGACLPIPVPSLILVGLTGNIASGKSEVARIMHDLGATVVDADQLAREAVRPSSPALAAILERWGGGVLLPDGSLDRAALRRVVFADPAQLAALNALVHPEVRRLRDRQVAAARARGDAVVVADIPLLFEVGLEKEMDRIVLVDAPEDIRLKRLTTRTGIAEDEARRMMAAQMPVSEKRWRAHFVIDNGGSLEELQRNTLAVWKRLLAEQGNAGSRRE